MRACVLRRFSVACVCYAACQSHVCVCVAPFVVLTAVVICPHGDLHTNWKKQRTACQPLVCCTACQSHVCVCVRCTACQSLVCCTVCQSHVRVCVAPICAAKKSVCCTACRSFVCCTACPSLASLGYEAVRPSRQTRCGHRGHGPPANR